MTHATRARKERGAKIVAVDVYMNGTMEQADLPVLIRPGTDGALACAVMHCLFRDDKRRLGLSRTLHRRAARARGARALARPAMGLGDHRLPGRDHRGVRPAARRAQAGFFRLGYGFSRSRNGAANMHAASCIPAVTGAWLHEGGGAFFNNRAIYHWDKTMIEGTTGRSVDPHARPVAHRRHPDRRAGSAGGTGHRSRRC